MTEYVEIKVPKDLALELLIRGLQARIFELECRISRLEKRVSGLEAHGEKVS